MKKLLLSIILFSTIITNSISQTTNIVGGNTIDITDVPWQVSLKSLSEGNEHF